MSICHYVLISCKITKAEMTSLVVCKLVLGDTILIKNLFELKGYNAKHLVREFPNKGWNVSSIYKLLQ